MKRTILFFLLITGMMSAQTIIFDAPNKWVLPIGRDSEATQKLKDPLRVELKNKQLKLYYPGLNKFYYKEQATPIKRVITLEKDGRTYFLLEFEDKEGMIFYFRITKDNDPNYGIVYGIEIPVIENGQIIAYETFY